MPILHILYWKISTTICTEKHFHAFFSFATFFKFDSLCFTLANHLSIKQCLSLIEVLGIPMCNKIFFLTKFGRACYVCDVDDMNNEILENYSEIPSK